MFFALALFGYPIVGSVISLTGIDSRILSVPFRISVCLFGAWLISVSRRIKIDGLRQVMLTIWFLYILRLLHDWIFTNLNGADYALQFFIVSSVVPAIALMKSDAYQYRRFALAGFLIAGVGTVVSLMAARLGGGDVTDVAESTGRLSLSAIDPVSLGNEATSAILCAMVLWRDARSGFRLILAGAFVVLLWCLVLTGSKGPALALALCVGLWALRRGYAWRFCLLAVPLVIWVAASSENPLAGRLAGSEDDQSTVDRLVMLNDSMSQIAESPLVGSAFVELNSGFYPHNVFIEAGLAFGVPVALIFCGLIAFGTYKAWRTLKTDYDLLGLIFFQGLFAASISAAIFGSILMWVTLAILPARTDFVRGSSHQPLGFARFRRTPIS